MAKHVVHSGTVECNMGSKTSTLIGTCNTQKGNNYPILEHNTGADSFKGGASPFGICDTLTAQNNGVETPCAMVNIPNWINTNTEDIIEGKPIVTMDSFTICLTGIGVIDPIIDGQISSSATKNYHEIIEEIINSNMDDIDKIDAIVKVYEMVIYEENKEAFDEYAITGDEAAIAAALQKSKTDIKAYAREMAYYVLQVANKKGGNFKEAIDYFISIVGTGNPLDLKARPLGDALGLSEYDFSIWAREWESNMPNDYMGNYTYGYFGMGYWNYLPFASEKDLLLHGAGLAQLKSDVSQNQLNASGIASSAFDIMEYLNSISLGEWGDNPGDSEQIQEGINAYEKSHSISGYSVAKPIYKNPLSEPPTGLPDISDINDPFLWRSRR